MKNCNCRINLYFSSLQEVIWCSEKEKNINSLSITDILRAYANFIKQHLKWLNKMVKNDQTLAQKLSVITKEIL